MSTEPTTDDEHAKWSPWAIAAAVLLLLLFGVIAVGTLRGCFFVDPQEAAKLDEEAKEEGRGKKKKKKPTSRFDRRSCCRPSRSARCRS